LEYLILDRPIEKLPRHFPRLSGAEVVYGTGQMWIYRLNTESPRAYLAHQVTAVDSETILDQEELPDFNRRTEALIDDDSMKLLSGRYASSQTGNTPDSTGSKTKIISYKRNSVVIDVESTEAGVLVLHDIFYPGWEVSVDGERKPVLRANLLFRGVEVPAGRHRVEFAFRPMSVENLLAAASEIVDSDEDSIRTATAAASIR
jgi:Bacterial membrane protein YfhO